MSPAASPEQSVTKEVEKPEDDKAETKFEVKSDVEHWWSSRFRNHRVAIDVPPGYVKFDGYALELDLSTEAGKSISKALHGCGQEGRDIFVVGKAYPDNEIGEGQKVSFLAKLRAIADDEEGDGPERIRSLFTRKELVKAGLSAAVEDVDRLIMLALKTKSIKGDMLK